MSHATAGAPGAATCPACGTTTDIPRDVEPELGGLAISEFEMLVRSEWRGRLGPAAYDEAHSGSLIRALGVIALAPDSPVRSAVVERLLWREHYRWGAAGVTRRRIRAELGELCGAVDRVLARTTLDRETRRCFAEQIDAKLRELLA